MRVDGRFLDLTRDQVIELGIEIAHSGNSAQVSAGNQPLFEIKTGVEVDEPRELSKYIVRLCFSGFSGEAQTADLKLRGSGNTIGYVFPVTAFRESSSIAGEWPRRFADVGFRSITTIDSLSEYANPVPTNSLRNQTVFLDDLLPDDACLLVVGVESLQRNNVSLNALELMLLRERITIISEPADLSMAARGGEWHRSINMTPPSGLITDDLPIFTALIKSADRDKLGVSAFMHLYQAMEFCIDHIFTWKIQDLLLAAWDVWEMKNRLSEITSEKHRLGILDSQCLSRLNDRTNLNELALCCREFLASINIELEQDVAWHSLLYQARNIIVHNQMKMMRARAVPLQPLTTALRDVCFDVLFAFNRPDDGPLIAVGVAPSILDPR